MSREDYPAENFIGKTFLGIDFGEKVIGMSIFRYGSDPFPLLNGRINVYKGDDPFKLIKEIVENDLVNYIILGIPYLTDGKESAMTHKVISFGKELASKIPEVTIIHQDETLSTYEAEERMKNDPKFNFKVDLQRIDEMSACIIMEQFFSERVTSNPTDEGSQE